MDDLNKLIENLDSSIKDSLLLKLISEDSENKAIISELQKELEAVKLERDAYQYKSEFWQTFVIQMHRLFGEKRGKLGDMLKRSMRELKLDCEVMAFDAVDKRQNSGVEQPETAATKPFKGFNVEKFKAYCDTQTTKNFSASYPVSAVKQFYVSQLYPPLSGEFPLPLGEPTPEPDAEKKRAAIIATQRKFNFQSYEACHKFLSRHEGVGKLPATWEKIPKKR